ncbi:arginine N-methyltransferase-like [Raphidocelis subcapitata]|uniref:type I protein arginine methyltransferase n=1 Tax=Raphidocelis subcapitata TaxID=307507 RepID=A0A2V0P879_9CHLO|nr:arginine N-methyltransferase-like [Raphidocelis subcapitata]|eukprot:GBF96074.1 arginine N-methyltransferase-like [Raphidocelis subcapitata]
MSDSDSDSGGAGRCDGGGAPAAAAAAAAAAALADWQDWDDDPEEDDATRSLFSDAVLPSPEACLAHDAAAHGFDVREFRAKLSLDDHGTIRLINFIRSRVAAGADPLPALTAAAAAAAANGAAGAAQPWASDDYLTPVLPDDPLLGYDFDEEAGDEGWAGGAGAGTSAGTDAPGAVAALAAENAALRARLAALAEAALPPELLEDALAGAAAAPGEGPGARCGAGSSSSGSGSTSSSSGSSSDGGSDGGGAPPPRDPSGSGGLVLPARRRGRDIGRRRRRREGGDGKPASASARIDAAYFESYSTFDIHREMLGDKPRTEAYRDALEANPSLIKGARVLDVGCGSGILSMFAALGGAASVVGLDASERIAGFARKNVAANGLDRESGGPVSIVTGRVEQVADIGSEQVDVIVSEWMGYALLFETMLDSVLAARDRWLRPGGAVLPDVATVMVAGGSDAAMGLDFWEDVYGFSMRPMADELRAAAPGRVIVREVPASALVTAAAEAHRMDLAAMAPSGQDFTAEVVLAAAQAGECSCVVVWFDAEFSARFCRERPVRLSTAPDAAPTHWMQAVLPLRAPVALEAGARLACRLSMARSPARHRALDVSLEYGAAGGAPGAREAVSFSMEVGGE